MYRALVAGDCDDSNASVNEEALEICNGIDDNCDGITDPAHGVVQSTIATWMRMATVPMSPSAYASQTVNTPQQLKVIVL